MVPPSPGIGFHNPMFRPYGSYGGFGSYGNPGRSSSIFSGLTSCLNNFASNYMTLAWTSFGVNTGLNILSMFFGGTTSTTSTSSSAAGGTGTAPTTSRSADDITKDLRKYGTMSGYGATDAADLKTKAEAEKTAKKAKLDTAKAAQLTDGNGNALKYSDIKAKFNYDTDTAMKGVLDAVFSGKDDDDPITAEELQKAITTIKNTPSYKNAISPESFVSTIGGNAQTALDNLEECQKLYDAAEAAAKEAASVTDLGNVDTKIEDLQNEYAAKKSGYTSAQISNLRRENENLQGKLDKLAAKGKGPGDRRYDNVKAQIDANNAKIALYDQYYNEAASIVADAKSKATAAGPDIPANPSTTSTSETSTSETSETSTSETSTSETSTSQTSTTSTTSTTRTTSRTTQTQTVKKKGEVYLDADGKPLKEPTDDVLKDAGMTTTNEKGVFKKGNNKYIFRNGKFLQIGLIETQTMDHDHSKVYSHKYRFKNGTVQIDRYDTKGNVKSRRIYDANGKLSAVNIFMKGSFGRAICIQYVPDGNGKYVAKQVMEKDKNNKYNPVDKAHGAVEEHSIEEWANMWGFSLEYTEDQMAKM